MHYVKLKCVKNKAEKKTSVTIVTLNHGFCHFK